MGQQVKQNYTPYIFHQQDATNPTINTSKFKESWFTWYEHYATEAHNNIISIFLQ
jgi:hypothetical protein